MVSHYFVLKSLRALYGDRFPVRKGELRVIHYFKNPPKDVLICRNRGLLDWGGCVIGPEDYRVLFDGVGPLPAEFIVTKSTNDTY